MPPISIDAIAIASPSASANPDATESLWQAWLTGDRRRIEKFPTYPALHAAAIRSTKELAANLSPPQRDRTGLILATTKGNIDASVRWLRAADHLPDSKSPPTLPPLGTTATEIATHANLRGPAWAVSTACSSGLTALIDAACVLLDDEADQMIALGLDYTGTPNPHDPTDSFIQDGFHALKAISPTACRPFDRDRDGLTLGSAAAVCLLSRNPSPRTRALLTGWGVASDAVHMTAPDRNARGLIQAMQNALATAQLNPHNIDLIFAHGTGTRYNDAMETVAINALFSPQNSPTNHRPAITAIKGLIGHTLGASGIIETALAIRILETQLIPPITGLRHPESTDLDLVTAPRFQTVRHIMKIASGFGGLNAAIILSHPDTERTQ